METSDVSQRKNRYFVYVLYCHKDNGFYIGYTTDLVNRLKHHSHGEVISTKNRLPITLLHYEYFIHKTDAKMREIFLKSSHGREQLAQILQRTLLMIVPDY